jgi:hypothetical protein
MTTTKTQQVLAFRLHRFQRIATAGGIQIDGLFSDAWVGQDGGRLDMELLPSVFVRADNFQDVADVRLCPNQGFEHIHQNLTLDDCGAFAGLAKIRIMRSKTLHKGWLNMSHEHPSNINWILLQIVECLMALRKVV